MTTVQHLLTQATTVANIAKETGLSRQTVMRIRDDKEACEAALARWGM